MDMERDSVARSIATGAAGTRGMRLRPMGLEGGAKKLTTEILKS